MYQITSSESGVNPCLDTFHQAEHAGASVARDLVQLGFAPRLAARVGAVTCYRDPHPEAVLTGSPAQIAAITPAPGSGFVHDRQTYNMPPHIPSTISIPVGRIWADIVEKAGRLRRARSH